MDMDALAEATFEVVQRYVAQEFQKRDGRIAEQAAEIASLKAAISSLPTPKDGNNGRDGTDGKDGLNGKDADPVVIDLDEVAQQIKRDRDFLAECKGEPGRDGKDGASVDQDQLEALTIKLVAKAVEAIPKPRDGTNGRDGRDGESPAIELVVAKLLTQIPKAAPGRDGRDGIDGKDGQRGNDAAVDIDALAARVLAAVPTPKDGVDGSDGHDGKDGTNGRDGVDGKGVELADVERLVEPRVASWALDFERRAQTVLRDAINAVPLPRDGRDGKDGEPGVGLDDFEFFAELLDDDRTVELGVRANGREVRKRFKLAIPIERGVYLNEKNYERGDCVTFGGQLYIAQRDTAGAAPGGSGDWRLAVKRGRDGKDAE